jgi:hypothetical protein
MTFPSTVVQVASDLQRVDEYGWIGDGEEW